MFSEDQEEADVRALFTLYLSLTAQPLPEKAAEASIFSVKSLCITLAQFAVSALKLARC